MTQTNVNGWAGKDSRERVHHGKGAIFSRWASDKKTPLSLDNVRVEPDGLCESAGYEGSFASVRRPFAWTKGTYTNGIFKRDEAKRRHPIAIAPAAAEASPTPPAK